MRRDKPWFGPMRWTPSPLFWKPISPVSWEGWTVTVALIAGLVSLKLEPDPIRRGLAFSLMVVAYGVVVALTWADEDGQRLRLRQALFSRGTLRFLAGTILFVAVFIAAGYVAARAPRFNRGCIGPACLAQHAP